MAVIEPPVELHGHCDPRFTAARDAFETNWSEHGEVGASLCVIVVDLWSGFADAARSRLWQRDKIVNVYSSTKGIATLAAAILVGLGEPDVERPVIDYWPEFGQAGKSWITVRHLLTHEAGLVGVDEALPDGAVLNWDYMVGALERQPQIGSPARGGYHAITYGCWSAR